MQHENRRLTLDEYFLNLAYVASLRSTCPRKRVGCILVDQHKRVLATGYNGTPRGMPHCLEQPCGGEAEGLPIESCMALHAEMNALLQCPDAMAVEAIYCTLSPCIHCIKLLLNTSASRLVVLGEYKDTKPKELWLKAGKSWDVMASPALCAGLPFACY